MMVFRHVKNAISTKDLTSNIGPCSIRGEKEMAEVLRKEVAFRNEAEVGKPISDVRHDFKDAATLLDEQEARLVKIKSKLGLAPIGTAVLMYGLRYRVTPHPSYETK